MRPPLFPCIALACTALLAPAAHAQEYSCDFSTGTGRATAYGNAVIDGGNLRLTQAIDSQSGALVLNTWAAGASCFEANFDYFFNSIDPVSVADGLSFNLGVLPDGVIPGAAEAGPGNGLTVEFELYDFNHDGFGGDLGIRVLSNGAIIGSYPDAITINDNGQFRHVRIYLDYSGTLTISYNGNTVVDNLATGFVPQPSQRFGLAARTGALNAEQRIDNVVVRPYYAQPSCSNSAAISGDGIWGYSYDGPGSPTEGSASCGDSGRDVWFCWQATVSGMATISTVDLTNDDSVLSVYDGCSPCSGGFGEMACNDDAGLGANPYASQVTVPVQAGGTYGIRVATAGCCNGDASGLEGMSITTQPDATPCPADFNRDGTKNVQDIFDFLSAWFAPCP